MFGSTASLPRSKVLSVDPTAQPIWCDGNGGGRNVFAHFRLTFHLAETPARAVLHLFADTRYRLRVNHDIVAYGPNAFLVAYPEFDSIDLVPWLRQGENEIAVEVNSRGDSSFQAEPSRGGFIAWGAALSTNGSRLAEFATPGKWRARRSRAWASESPPFSFAQGPVEIVSLSELPASGHVVDGESHDWHAPVPAQPEHWGKFSPRSIPLPRFETWKPERVVTLAPLASRQVRLTAHRSLPPGTIGDRQSRFAYALWLHSPQQQQITLSLSPGDHWLNGDPMPDVAGGGRVLETQRLATLREGWNLLYGECTALMRLIGVTVAWPADAAVQARAFPELAHPAGAIRLSTLLPIEELHALRGAPPANVADLERLSDVLERTENHTAFPSREVAWDEAVPTDVPQPDLIEPLDIPRSTVGEGLVVYDFGREFIGHIRLEIEAPAGGIVDVTNEELQRADGSVRMFQPNIAINPVDRLYLRPGVNHWEGFHARGGRLVQLTVRSTGPVVVRRITLRSALVEVPHSGTFTSSDPVMNWAWDAGVATLVASQTDGWVDPWREQGLYIGDVLVEYLAHRVWSRDTSHIVRALRMWGRSQRPDGQLQAVVPSWYRRAHGDYTLLWIIILRDYVHHSGDHALARELWPVVERIWSSPTWQPGPHGLWNADDVNVFGDWGATQAAIVGEANGILNAFRIGALAASAELADAIGDSELASAFREEREEVAAAFRAALWDPRQQVFAPAIQHETFVETSAAHVNVLALLYRIATPAQERGALAAVRRALAAATAAPERCERRGGHLELYFLHYVLEAFGERGLHADAEDVIRTFWGLQRDHGAWCLWEAFYRGLRQEDSQCHGWSAGPSVYFHRFVLGVDATPTFISIKPRSATLTHAHGVFPHPRGDVTIAWRIDGNTFHLEVELPEGLKHDVLPGPPFSHLTPRINIRRRADA